MVLTTKEIHYSLSYLNSLQRRKKPHFYFRRTGKHSIEETGDSFFDFMWKNSCTTHLVIFRRTQNNCQGIGCGDQELLRDHCLYGYRARLYCSQWLISIIWGSEGHSSWWMRKSLQLRARSECPGIHPLFGALLSLKCASPFPSALLFSYALSDK